jgi:hypothetical protein
VIDAKANPSIGAKPAPEEPNKFNTSALSSKETAKPEVPASTVPPTSGSEASSAATPKADPLKKGE